MIGISGWRSFYFAGVSAVIMACSAVHQPAAAQIVEGYDMAKLPPPLKEKLRINAGAVSILVSGSTCTCARFAEDIRYVVNDVNNPRPGGVRMVPVLGEGGIQNLKDTLFLRGINMAMVDESTLKVQKERDPRVYGDIDNRLRYIAKLYNAEFHVLASKEIKSLADLSGKVVNFDYRDSETDLMAIKVFGYLKVKPLATHDDQRFALKRLLAGDIAAVAVSTGAPQEILTRIPADAGLHLLPLSEAALPGRNLKPIFKDYLPAELTHDSYPNLIPEGESVPTAASRVLLAIYNWPEDNVRYLRNAKFVNEFFNRIGEFRNPARHPKWKDVNLAAEVPGWKRFKPAQQWLDAHADTLVTASTHPSPPLGPQEAVKATFDNFMTAHEGVAGTGDETLSPDERAALYSEFKTFMDEHEGRVKSAR